ncbi:D-arabinono-1,4-lactone oxidase [Saccharopolyspora sp. TS4A08]|uniref:D-arabinono-1,4-lactone oxidase n=1 Tax=Saccharopolyspora ipomoeae TaxID=3042027 RepID=A0ABT6PXA4_9PSEU|nr:D-arabinono-1,4-lactone oxidase [Saccharopolyspora sp. TS4A08]MDI2032658.1 D-arabinono-1,4-lactone oxidase [Saccharopolyspora sp. TS4A08]
MQRDLAPGSPTPRDPNTARPWTNWGRTATARPARTATPRDTSEAAEVIAAATRDGLRVRPIGSGHSFSAVASPESGVALDLRHFTGIVHADPATGLVTAHGGTPLHVLNAELDGLGLAMANLGDIDQQTLAGAISTGTHGTGAGLGGLSTQVEALDLLLADGSEVSCSAAENPELFAAARLGLGALGVITTVTLRCVPSFTLSAEEGPAPLEEVLGDFHGLAEANDHFEFHWFPHSHHAMVKRNNRHPGPPRPLSPARHFLEYEVMENRLFGAVCGVGRAVPALVRPLSRLCASTWSARSYRDRSYRVFTTPRRIRFVESEYAFPREVVPEVLRELRAATERLADPVMFPVEVRVARADDVWLSTAHGRDTGYVAVHQYLGMPYRSYFDAFESIARDAGGRPHWGKMHRLDATALSGLYPRFTEFRQVRDSVDPGGIFHNAYLERVLGPVDNPN